MILRRLVLGFFLAVIVAPVVVAHPHVFINNKVTVVFDGGKLSGMTFRWAFDDMFSEMLLTDFKPDAEGNFTPKVTRDHQGRSIRQP